MEIQIEIELKEFIKKLTKKVTDLSILQDNGVGVEEELVDVECDGLSVNTISNLQTKVDTLMPDIDEQPLQLMKEKIEANKKRAEDLYKRLIEVELDCSKYNIPRLNQFQELELYEKDLQKYMKTWRDEAKLNRQKGYKNVKELLQRLHQSSQDGHLLTFEEVKLVIMSTGVNLTGLLVDFLFLGSPTTQKLAKRLRLVRTALGCLSVEDYSVIMDTVLDILKVGERKAMEENLIIQEKDKASTSEGNGSSSSSSSYMSREEANIFRKILREFARFEACFCCPRLPFMYSNDVLIDIGKMFKTQSEEKMNRISCKIGELKKVEIATTGYVSEDLKMNQLKLILSSTHIEDKWWDLDLQPNA